MATIAEALAAAIQHHQAGRFAVAEGIYRQILAVAPGNADAWHLLGILASQSGRQEFAVDCYRRALQLSPNDFAIISNLGVALQSMEKWAESADYCRRAADAAPDSPEAHYNLGVSMMALGRLEEAEAAYRRSLALRPDSAEACNNLGNVVRAMGNAAEALELYRRALAIKPDYLEATVNLAVAHQADGELGQAIAHYRRALELNANCAEAHNGLGAALADMGQREEAVSCFRKALLIKSDYAGARSNLLLSLQYRPGITLAELADAHREFEQAHGRPLRAQWPEHDNDRDPHRPLRVGFVSADFGRHPVGFFLAGLLEKIDRRQYQTVCYSDRILKDELTARLRAAAGQWREVQSMSDEALAQMIHADRIDILFDLAGHTARNRLMVFARKPAPLQVTWAGYVGTTGLAAMDYLLADERQAPPDAQPHYIERVLRMPDGYVCYSPPAYAPQVSPLPALASGRVTFGSFNNVAKLNDSLLQAWARILLRVPRSQLVLKFRGMSEPSIAGYVARTMQQHGVDASRVQCLGHSDHAALLAEYGRIDLALDPFPYGGGLSTCEALWMGVPVVTWPGQTFAGRHALSHLWNVGLKQMIAGSVDQYVDLAAKLAEDLPSLASLRATLRPQMAASALCDAERFADNWQKLMREIWQEWATR